MRLTKIYTKIGDSGTTQLATGERVSKSSRRISAYGTIDELNAVTGMLRDEIIRAKKDFPSVHVELDLTVQLSSFKTNCLMLAASCRSQEEQTPLCPFKLLVWQK
jgi:cob(I)alamin adenosyltransferase